jgi:hypothetical protein
VLNCCKLLWTILSGFSQKITDLLEYVQARKITVPRRDAALTRSLQSSEFYKHLRY